MTKKRNQKKDKEYWEKPSISRMKLSETLKHEIAGEENHQASS